MSPEVTVMLNTAARVTTSHLVTPSSGTPGGGLAVASA